MSIALKLVIEPACESKDFRAILLETDKSGRQSICDILEAPRTEVNWAIRLLENRVASLLENRSDYYGIELHGRYDSFDFGRAKKLSSKVAKIVAVLPRHDLGD